MKIERINENQIKFTLTRSDLASRQLRLSELAYGTEKARGLFQDMMDQASMEFGFDLEDTPIMIETIPVSMDCIILMITKVDNPDEVDTRFSSLASLKDLFSNASDDSYAFTISEGALETTFSELGELARRAVQGVQSNSEKLYSFRDLETVIDFAHHIQSLHTGESSLYKSPENGRYYLKISCDTAYAGEFTRICAAATEFGENEPLSSARAAYMKEHFEEILNGNAVQSLAYV